MVNRSSEMRGYLNQVFTGDCVAVLTGVPTASVDFVLTDPPYLVNYQDRTGRKIFNDDKATWLHPHLCRSCPRPEA